VLGLELAIEQGEAAGLQPRDQMREGDLRGVAHPGDHRFAEEGSAEREAVEPAGQPVAVPALDRMREAAAVELEEDALDRAVDPGVGPVRRDSAQSRMMLFEFRIGGDAETIGEDRLAERARKVEIVERQDAAQLRLDPIDAGGMR
jgi:hypothetical protein